MSDQRAICCAALLCALAGGCDQGDPHDAGPDSSGDADADSDADQDGDGDVDQTCWSCHGTETSPAPPPDVSGSSDRSSSGVGAHAEHLAVSPWRASVRCGNCHQVPDTADAAGHVDSQRPADVAFSGLATVGVDARREEGGCVVYCHGGAMRVDPRESPEWTSDEDVACTACHGLPPGGEHPAASDCARCHLEVVDAAGAIREPGLHIDSVMQAPGGAHIVHLGGRGGSVFECTECHQGVAYHAPLRDGHTLDETTICFEACHSEGEVTPASWRSYDPL